MPDNPKKSKDHKKTSKPVPAPAPTPTGAGHERQPQPRAGVPRVPIPDGAGPNVNLGTTPPASQGIGASAAAGLRRVGGSIGESVVDAGGLLGGTIKHVGGSIRDAGGAVGGTIRDAGGAIGGTIRDAGGAIGGSIRDAGGAIRGAVGLGPGGTETGSNDGERERDGLASSAASGIRHVTGSIIGGLGYNTDSTESINVNTGTSPARHGLFDGFGLGLGIRGSSDDDDESIYTNDGTRGGVREVPRQMVEGGYKILESGASHTGQLLDDLGDFAMMPARELMTMRRRAGGPKEGVQTKINAPQTLVVTMDSGKEEEMEGYRYILRRRMSGGSGEGEDALDYITKQIHDLGELEWMLDDEFKILLRRHVIYWKSALAMPRRKLKIRVANIPLAATKDYSHHLSKWARCCRRCSRCCSCSAKGKGMMEDCMTVESLANFRQLQEDIRNTPTTTSVAIKSHMRRAPVFDATLPAYAAFLMPK